MASPDPHSDVLLPGCGRLQRARPKSFGCVGLHGIAPGSVPRRGGAAPAPVSGHQQAGYPDGLYLAGLDQPYDGTLHLVLGGIVSPGQPDLDHPPLYIDVVIVQEGLRDPAALPMLLIYDAPPMLPAPRLATLPIPAIKVRWSNGLPSFSAPRLATLPIPTRLARAAPSRQPFHGMERTGSPALLMLWPCWHCSCHTCSNSCHHHAVGDAPRSLGIADTREFSDMPRSCFPNRRGVEHVLSRSAKFLSVGRRYCAAMNSRDGVGPAWYGNHQRGDRH